MKQVPNRKRKEGEGGEEKGAYEGRHDEKSRGKGKGRKKGGAEKGRDIHTSASAVAKCITYKTLVKCTVNTLNRRRGENRKGGK